MADKSILELPEISSVTGDEYFYGVQGTGDVKIVADELADYILNSYVYRQGNNNKNVVEGKINTLMAIADFSDLADKTYPVGSLFWSKNSTSPASRFGGTWTRVKDVFALAAGNTYAAGKTGGSSTHLLATSEIPSHNHGGTSGGPSTNASGEPSTANTGNNSTGHTHTIPSLSGTTGDGGKHTHTPNTTIAYNWSTGDVGKANYEALAMYVGRTVNWSKDGAHYHSVTTAKGTSNGISANHTHGLASHTHTLSDHTHTVTAQGGGGPHDNMPPYVTYYCWERIE